MQLVSFSCYAGEKGQILHLSQVIILYIQTNTQTDGWIDGWVGGGGWIVSTWDLWAGENDFVQLCSLSGEVRSVRIEGKHLITYRHENPSVL